MPDSNNPIKQNHRLQNIVRCLLLLALFAYTVKNLFVGADIDEGYGIMVGYRLATGDRLLLEMWEPHQTSAVFTALFIKVFLGITGGSLNFLNLYLRVVFFMGQGLLAWLLYRTLRTCMPQLSKNAAVLSALFFYVTSPKGIYIPEYSNLHIWFFTLLCLCLIRYCHQPEKRGSLWYLAGAGVSLACDVLAYPSMAVLFPFCVIYMGWKNRRQAKRGLRECLAFTAPCVAGAAAFIGYLLSYLSWEQILQILPHILGEGSHQATFSQKLTEWAGSFGQMAGMLAVGGAVSLAVTVFWRRRIDTEGKRKQGVMFLTVFFVVLLGYQIYCWLAGDFGAIYPQILYVMISLSGIWCSRQCRDNEQEEMPRTGFGLILLSCISYFAVLALSNWPPVLLNTYLVWGVLGGLLCWACYFEKHAGKKGRRLLELLSLLLVFGNVFGYSYLMIGGDELHSSVFSVGGYNRQGVRAGILTSYMTAYRYNQNAEIWPEAVPDGSKVLYVGTSQFFCLLGEHTQACPDTICSLVYDEHLLDYWEINPDRYPDVVVVESWFGDIREFGEDSFIMQWIRNDFQPSEVLEYPYITVFRK